MKNWLVGSALLLTMLAGCTSEPEAGDPVVVDEPDVDGVAFENIGLESNWTPTLEEPPQWARGQWWKYELTDLFTGDTQEFTRIVAGREMDDYLVGFPEDAFSDRTLVMHVPGFGDVSMEDLSFEAHDVRFQPLRFPLAHGESWTTSLMGAPEATATVAVESDTVAQVEIVGPSDNITLTYDAKLGAITSFEKAGYARFEVIDHGTDYQGIVRVPHAHDLVFMHGRLAGAADINDFGIPFEPAEPTEEVVVEEGYDRISFANILVGDLAGAGVAQGVFRETVTAPDGTVFETTLTPADGVPIKIEFFALSGPSGTWSMEHVAGGAGLVLAEGIAFHSIVVDLARGCVLPDEFGNFQHHGNQCS